MARELPQYRGMTVRTCQTMTVIRTEAHSGAGTEDNPYRMVIQYWSTDGECLAIRDSFKESQSVSRDPGATYA